MAKQIDPQKQELRFPVDWEFRVIVETAKAEAARPALAAVLEKYEQPPLLHNGLNSSSGRYQTFKGSRHPDFPGNDGGARRRPWLRSKASNSFYSAKRRKIPFRQKKSTYLRKLTSMSFDNIFLWCYSFSATAH